MVQLFIFSFLQRTTIFSDSESGLVCDLAIRTANKPLTVTSLFVSSETMTMQTESLFYLFKTLKWT